MPGMGNFRRYDDDVLVFYTGEARWSFSWLELEDSSLDRHWWQEFYNCLYALHDYLEAVHLEVQTEIKRMFSVPGVLDAVDSSRCRPPQQESEVR